MTTGSSLVDWRLASTASAKPATSPGTRELGAVGFLLLCAGHVLLAQVSQRYPAVATAHALTTLLVGLWLAVEDRRPERILYLCSYVVGAELLWRVSEARVFWEYSKYLVILFSWITILRYGLVRRGRRSYLLFLVLLLPALAVLPYFDRRQIAFNLSGPVCLGVAALMFSVVRLDRSQVVNLLTACLVPIVGLTALAAGSTLSAREFIAGSSATTAGFGPNQFSSALGLGMFLAFMLVFLVPDEKVYLRCLAVILALWCGVQCLLTFSRGGMWGSLAAVVIASWYLLQHRQARGLLLATALIVTPVLAYFVIPMVDDFTGGVATKRFYETSLTGRDLLMRGDMLAFLEHPLLGVGPGQSEAYHVVTFRRASSHTEYTRLLAEHGLFGLWALLLILRISFQRLRKRGSPLEMSLTVSLTLWTLLYFGHSAMRLAAPGFIFALAGASFLLDDTGDRSMPEAQVASDD